MVLPVIACCLYDFHAYLGIILYGIHCKFSRNRAQENERCQATQGGCANGGNGNGGHAPQGGRATHAPQGGRGTHAPQGGRGTHADRGHAPQDGGHAPQDGWLSSILKYLI